jgi:hypothetical protein
MTSVHNFLLKSYSAAIPHVLIVAFCVSLCEDEFVKRSIKRFKAPKRQFRVLSIKIAEMTKPVTFHSNDKTKRRCNIYPVIFDDAAVKINCIKYTKI